jgi:hypothetical protein
MIVEVRTHVQGDIFDRPLRVDFHPSTSSLPLTRSSGHSRTRRQASAAPHSQASARHLRRREARASGTGTRTPQIRRARGRNWPGFIEREIGRLEAEIELQRCAASAREERTMTQPDIYLRGRGRPRRSASSGRPVLRASGARPGREVMSQCLRAAAPLVSHAAIPFTRRKASHGSTHRRLLEISRRGAAFRTGALQDAGALGPPHPDPACGAGRHASERAPMMLIPEANCDDLTSTSR